MRKIITAFEWAFTEKSIATKLSNLRYRFKNYYMLFMFVVIASCAIPIAWFINSDNAPTIKTEAAVTSVPDISRSTQTDLLYVTDSLEGNEEVGATNNDPLRNPLFDGTKVGHLLDSAFNLLIQSEELYQEALNGLRLQPNVASEKIISAYRKLGGEFPIERFMMMYLLGDVESETAMPFLSETLYKPLERGTTETLQGHHGHADEYRDEVLVRLMAVRGLEKLALKGDENARYKILELSQVVGDFTLKSDLMLAYLDSSQQYESDLSMLRDQLPKEQHYLLFEDKESGMRELEKIFSEEVQ
ncbi:MAG: hypothetical protein K6L75_03540 [Cellvibrionaceae bacterium]